MKLNTFLKLVGFLFATKAVFGIFYFLFGWEVNIAGMVFPNWIMAVAIVVDALLASAAFKFVKK